VGGWVGRWGSQGAAATAAVEVAAA
jgi:hypothetical protein